MSFVSLNTALRWRDDYRPAGKLVVIKDTLSADGSFLLHHFLNSFLLNNSPQLSQLQQLGAAPITATATTGNSTQQQFSACLVSFNQTYFHYATIERKLGVNLAQEGAKSNFAFIDAMSLPYNWSSSNNSDDGDNNNNPPLLSYISPINVFQKLPQDQQQETPKFLKVSTLMNTNDNDNSNPIDRLWKDIMGALPDNRIPDCILLDHVNPLLEMDGVSHSLFFEFVRSLLALTRTKNTCVVLMLHSDASTSNEADDNENSEEGCLLHAVDHMADILFEVDGLATGYSKDVHGQVHVTYVPEEQQQQHAHAVAMPKRVMLHFKTFEHQVKFFSPGSKS